MEESDIAPPVVLISIDTFLVVDFSFIVDVSLLETVEVISAVFSRIDCVVVLLFLVPASSVVVDGERVDVKFRLLVVAGRRTCVVVRLEVAAVDEASSRFSKIQDYRKYYMSRRRFM